MVTSCEYPASYYKGLMNIPINIGTIFHQPLFTMLCVGYSSKLITVKCWTLPCYVDYVDCGDYTLMKLNSQTRFKLNTYYFLALHKIPFLDWQVTVIVKKHSTNPSSQLKLSITIISWVYVIKLWHKDTIHATHCRHGINSSHKKGLSLTQYNLIGRTKPVCQNITIFW